LTESGLVEAVTGEAQREARAVDGGVHVAHQIGEGPDVVLVTVGEHDAVDVAGALAQQGEVRQHEVDPGHLGVGEHHPAVEHDEAALLL